MKNILKLIGGIIVAVLKKVTGVSTDTAVKLPDSIAITTEQIDHVINIVDNLKGAVSSPVAVIVTSLIPGTLDNYLRAMLAEALPVMLAALTFSRDKINADGDLTLNEVLAKIKLSDKPEQDALWHALAARLIIIASDGKVTWSEAVSFIEVYFKNVFTVNNK